MKPLQKELLKKPSDKARLSAIVAVGQNRELGKGGDLVWKSSADMKRMKNLTMGHPIIMGRKTYDSIGRPLPGRTNIVVTRNTDLEIPGCVVVTSLKDALEYARRVDEEEIFIFGGAQIYEEALPYVTRLYLTLFEADDREADVFFPPYSQFKNIIERERRTHDGDVPFTWMVLER